jgi:hypothetical protein
MLDIVAPDENEASAGIDGGGIEDLQPGLAIAASAHERRRAAAATHYPQDSHEADECEADPEHRHDEPAPVGAHHICEHLSSLLMPTISLNRLFFPGRGKAWDHPSTLKCVSPASHIGQLDTLSRLLWPCGAFCFIFKLLRENRGRRLGRSRRRRMRHAT